VPLQPSDAHHAIPRHYLELVSDAQRSVDEGARHDGAKPAHGEDPVDRKARPALVGPSLRSIKQSVERSPQLVEALPAGGRHREHLGSRQRRPLKGLANLRRDELQPRLVDEVGLRQHDDAAMQIQEVHDLEVLPGLGHHALIRRNHEKDSIDSVRPSEHVADEAGVAWNIDDADLAPARKPQVSEAKVDGHPAPFLLSKAVRVDARQCDDERRLAVVDVSRRADHKPSLPLEGGRSGRGVRAGSHRESVIAGRSAQPPPPRR